MKEQNKLSNEELKKKIEELRGVNHNQLSRLIHILYQIRTLDDVLILRTETSGKKQRIIIHDVDVLDYFMTFLEKSIEHLEDLSK